MIARTHARRCIAAATLLLLGACQAQAPLGMQAGPAIPVLRSVPHQVLHASATCGTEEPSVRRIGGPGPLKEIMGSDGPSGATLPQNGTGMRFDTDADFTRSLVLRVSMGQQPTAGAALAVRAARLDTRTQQLTLDATWSPPDPGRMHATVVTRPCVLLSVPRGDYRSVRVVDQEGRVRVSAPLAAER